MGLPLVLLLLLLRPVTPMSTVSTASPCSALLPDTSEELDLSNRSRGCAELDWSPFQRQRRLLLRNNGIESLSPRARLGPNTEELDLAENRLRELPRGFFSNATKLRTLRLEGNPLPSVPPAAFQPELSSLSVSCRCDLLATVLAPCSRSGIRCVCLTARQNSFNVTQFHGRECGSRVGLVAGVAAAVAVVAVLVALGAAGLWYRRRRAGAAVGGGGRGKQDPAGKLRQPRYISREPGIADGTDGPDYENIFVSRGAAPAAAQGWAQGWQEQSHGPQVLVDDNYFLESATDPGDQPIYANTLGPSEDVYIIPDQ